MGEREDFALDTAFLYIIQRILRLKERRLPISLILLAFYGIRCGNEFLQSEELKVLGKELSEIAPFRVITRQQDCLAPKDIGVVFDIGVYFFLNVCVLCVELVVLRIPCYSQISVFSHGLIVCGYPSTKQKRKVSISTRVHGRSGKKTRQSS